MVKLPPMTGADLDPAAAAKLRDSVRHSRGSEADASGGGLSGPFDAWLRAPLPGLHLAEVGAALRFGSVLDQRLLELAIITVGAHWQAEYEWWVHARLAKKHGISPTVIDAIGRGDVPVFEDDREAVVHAIAREAVHTGKVSESLLRQALDALGERGLVELVCLCGYYTTVSFTLNAFSVGLPDGVTPMWSTVE